MLQAEGATEQDLDGIPRNPQDSSTLYNYMGLEIDAKIREYMPQTEITVLIIC